MQDAIEPGPMAAYLQSVMQNFTGDSLVYVDYFVNQAGVDYAFYTPSTCRLPLVLLGVIPGGLRQALSSSSRFAAGVASASRLTTTTRVSSPLAVTNGRACRS